MSFLSTHCCISIAAHTDSDQVFSILGTFYTFTEELVDDLLVGTIIPYSILTAVTGPFLMVTGHRFMVRSSHYDAHLVGHLAVHRIVRIEGPAPHCRPEIVSAKTEDEFEYTLIETMVAIFGTVCMLHPSCEAWSLIIKEDTTVTDSRFAGCI